MALWRLLSITLTLIAAQIVQARDCSQVEFKAYSQTSNFNVQPLPGLDVNLFWMNLVTGEEVYLPLGKTDSSGSVRVSKNKLRELFLSNGGYSNYMEVSTSIAAPQTHVLPWSFSEDQIKVTRSVHESAAIFEEMTKPQSCEPIVLTENNRFMEDIAPQYRRKYSSIWFLQKASDFLHTLSLQKDLARPVLPTKITFSASNSNSYAVPPTPDRQFSEMVLEASETRVAYATLHEMGHAFAFNFLDLNTDGGDHTHMGCYSTQLALNEGWATFFALVVLDRIHANLDSVDLRYNMSDDNLFYHYPRNHTPAADSLFTVASSDGTPACYTIENEVVVFSLLFSLYKQGGIPFEEIMRASQSRINGKKNDSVLTVLDNLKTMFPERRGFIDSKIKELVKQ